MKKNIYMHKQDALLNSRNEHPTVNQLYFN